MPIQFVAGNTCGIALKFELGGSSGYTGLHQHCMEKRTFASDNYAGVHPAILEALTLANAGHAPSYGSDEYTERAAARFRTLFGADVKPFFVYNGTGANVSALSAMTRSFHAIICSELAHINVDESTAPEHFTGCKLLPIPTEDGKIYPHQIEDRIQRIGDQHHPQARVISISQCTEYGTVYTVDEVRAIAATARQHNLVLHMDGSRISNAAVALDAPFRAFTRDAGVDVLSFGGTKNGLMFGEAVLFFNADLASDFQYIRKQAMQLHSKMRFIGAQFDRLLADDLWAVNARHANDMAQELARRLCNIDHVTITRKVEANSVFVILPPGVAAKLQESYFFYPWNEKINEYRLMCAFDTTLEDVEDFVGKLERLMQ
ncbi:MAG TPA: low specificity L-threonine aldolase [Cyclobacteriaceae bacterium]|nr:low specificity L-threonine aldolase [Cyclobacteriaceae bacterium]